jgi:hypothetical protein
MTVSDFNNAQNVSMLQCPQFCTANTVSSPIRPSVDGDPQFILSPGRGMTIKTAILVSLACCIPTLISLATTWNKILAENAIKLGFMNQETDAGSAHSRAREAFRQRVANFFKAGLHLAELTVFVVFSVLVVILGEINFWSPQMRSGVEPMQAVGKSIAHDPY